MELEENFNIHDYDYAKKIALQRLWQFHASISEKQLHIAGNLVLSAVFDDFYFTVKIDSILLKFELWTYLDNGEYLTEILCKRISPLDSNHEYVVGSIKIDSRDHTDTKLRGRAVSLRQSAALIVSNFFKKSLSKDAFDHLSRPKH